MVMAAFNQIFKKAVTLLGSTRYDGRSLLRIGHREKMTKVPLIPKAISIRRLQTSTSSLMCTSSNEGKRIKSVEPTTSSSNPKDRDDGQEDWFPAFNENCEWCKEIREMSPEDRGKLQHYLMFQNLCSLLHYLESYFERRLTRNSLIYRPIFKSMRVRCKFMCIMTMRNWTTVFDESFHKPDEYKADFEVIMRLCDQLSSDEYPCDTFNCAEYETFLRSLRNVARLFDDAHDIVKTSTHLLQHKEKNRDSFLDPTQLLWKRVCNSVSHDPNIAHKKVYYQYLLSGILYIFKCH